MTKLVAEQAANGVDPTTITVTTATDGNHGRSVAWGAQQAGCRAEIYIHQHVSQKRADAMAAYGANINQINGNYEASLATCSQMQQRITALSCPTPHGRAIVPPHSKSWLAIR